MIIITTVIKITIKITIINIVSMCRLKLKNIRILLNHKKCNIYFKVVPLFPGTY